MMQFFMLFLNIVYYLKKRNFDKKVSKYKYSD